MKDYTHPVARCDYCGKAIDEVPVILPNNKNTKKRLKRMGFNWFSNPMYQINLDGEQITLHESCYKKIIKIIDDDTPWKMRQRLPGSTYK